MRSPASNPFLPGSDAIPPVWAGRALELADFTDVLVPRRLAGIYERGRIVLGEPGIGKSVLVHRIAAEAAASGHWVLPGVRLAARDDPVARLIGAGRSLLEARAAPLGASLTRVLERVTAVTLPGGAGVRLADAASTPVTHELLTELLTELGRAARDDGKVVVVRVDEVQHLEGAGLSQLLTSLGDALNVDFIGRPGTTSAGVADAHVVKLPIVVYLSGLPEFSARASRAKATFARRFKLLELGVLDDADLQLALRPFVTDGWETFDSVAGTHRVRMEPAAAEVLVAAAQGSPFLFQLVGEAAWNAGTGAVVTAEEASRGVAASAREIDGHFALRLADLSERQRAYLLAAAAFDDGDRTAANVAAALGSTSAAVASTAQALDVRHRLVRRVGGKVVIRSPGLLAYLRRQRS